VRFAEEIAGVPDIGAMYRGEKMEITTLEQAVASELSANIIDLCPVGALTSKPYAFNARPWELTKTESIDVLDAVGANIRVDTRGAEVLRILPRLHEDINEEWLSDKSRYACDGLKRQRLDKPYVRVGGTLQPASWDDAFGAIAAKISTVKPAEIAAIAGDLGDVEAMYSLRLLLDNLGVASRDCRQDGALLDANDRASYIFNTSIAGIEQADLLLLIGTNPRLEAPLLNARIRKRYLTGKLKIALIGEAFDLTYPYEHLGKTAGALEKVLSGRSAFAKGLKDAQNPMLILGMGALTREDSKGIVATAVKIAEKFGFIKDGWNGYNVLQTAAGRVGGLDVKFVPTQGGLSTSDILTSASANKTKVVYLLGADEIDTEKLKNAFVIYQGHHGDKGASVADVILPAAAYTEKNACYVNLEGRVQYTQNATLPVGEAREDWKIIRALSAVLRQALPFDTLAELRQCLAAENPVFATQDEIIAAPWKPNAGSSTALLEMPFQYPIQNFYQTDPISRASKTMAECAKVFVYGKGADIKRAS
jgi:NADH-quinone oxidoreductase subunit G